MPIVTPLLAPTAATMSSATPPAKRLRHHGYFTRRAQPGRPIELGKLLGRGSHGMVFSAVVCVDGVRTAVAAKLETDDSRQLANEVEVLRALAAASGETAWTPNVHWHGTMVHEETELPAFAMDLCGPSLYALRKTKCAGGKLSAKSALMVGEQLLAAFEHVHDLGFLQVTVKEANVVVRANAAERLMLVDFGRGCSYLDAEGDHVRACDAQPAVYGQNRDSHSRFVGTCFSVNGWHGRALSRRDDLVRALPRSVRTVATSLLTSRVACVSCSLLW